MPKKLKNLLIDRVDLVKRGDNPDARITLFKGDQTPERGGVIFPIDKFFKGLEDFMGRMMKKGDDRVMQFKLKDFLEKLPQETRGPLEERVGKLSEDVRKGIETRMGELKEEERSVIVLNLEVEKAESAATFEALKKQLESNTAELEALKKDPKEGTKDDPAADGDVPEDVIKGLPEAVQKILRDSQKEAKEAKDLVKKLEDEAMNREYVAKAMVFKALPIKAEELGPVLKRVAQSSKDDYDKVEAVLKAANELVERNNLLMKELGASGGSDTGSDVWTRVETAANNLIAKSADPLSKEQAIAQVLRDNPELYSEYQKELKEV
ncbi:MAG: hypothetical protein WC239_06060 [Sphaerochaetaceae bacterium]